MINKERLEDLIKQESIIYVPTCHIGAEEIKLSKDYFVDYWFDELCLFKKNENGQKDESPIAGLDEIFENEVDAKEYAWKLVFGDMTPEDYFL